MIWFSPFQWGSDLTEDKIKPVKHIFTPDLSSTNTFRHFPLLSNNKKILITSLMGASMSFSNIYCYDQQLNLYNALHNLDSFQFICNIAYESLTKGSVHFFWYFWKGLTNTNIACSYAHLKWLFILELRMIEYLRCQPGRPVLGTGIGVSINRND